MRRPEGTDGSDHQYREKVEDLYKGMPVWRAAGWMLLHISAIPTILKFAWAILPYYTLKTYPEITPLILVGCYLLAVILWQLAKPASYKESLVFMKMTNVVLMGGISMHVVSIYRYYSMIPKQQMYARRFYKYMIEEAGYQGEHWRGILSATEVSLDLGIMFIWGATAYCLHGYIMRKMAMNKKLGRDKKRSDAQDQVVSPPKGVAPRSRRPGRA